MGGRHVCPVCGARVGTLRALIRHFRREHVYGDLCPCCGARVKSLAKHAEFFLDKCHALAYLAATTAYGGSQLQMRRRARAILVGDSREKSGG